MARTWDSPRASAFDGHINSGFDYLGNAPGNQLGYIGGPVGNPAANRFMAWNGSEFVTASSDILGAGGYIDHIGRYDDDHISVAGHVLDAGPLNYTTYGLWDGTSWSTLGDLPGGPGTSYFADLVSGSFVVHDKSSTDGIYYWDGLAWQTYGGGLSNLFGANVWAHCIHNGVPWFGGQFSSRKSPALTLNHITYVSGGVFQEVKDSGLTVGMNQVVRELASDGTYVYAGGNFTSAGGTAANKVAAWNGTDWVRLGGAAGMNDNVWSLTMYNGDLVAGGEFTQADGVAALRIARWDGSSWSAMGGGSGLLTYALGVFGGDLYAAGSFDGGSYGVGKWDESSSTWSGVDGSGSGTYRCFGAA